MSEKESLKGKEVKCNKCGWYWMARTDDPRQCANPECRSPYWNLERDETGKIIRENLNDPKSI